MKKKAFITKITNCGNFNELDIEKSEMFLDNLQDFLVNVGLVRIKKGDYETDGKSYDVNTYYTLFYEDPKNDFETRKLRINEFGNGKLIRYFNKEIELLIIFIENKIKLIFYSNEKNRKKIMTSLLKFCQIMKVKK